MKPGKIANMTRALGAPIGWDHEKQGVCGTLPIRDDQDRAGHSMTSAWYPSPEEIEAMKNGAPVLLNVLGTIHPPVALSVGNPSEAERPDCAVDINGEAHVARGGVLTYEQVVELAGLRGTPSVVFSNADQDPRSGILAPGDGPVRVKDDTHITAVHTGNA